MHKNIMIYNSEYKIVTDETPQKTPSQKHIMQQHETKKTEVVTAQAPAIKIQPKTTVKQETKIKESNKITQPIPVQKKVETKKNEIKTVAQKTVPPISTKQQIKQEKHEPITVKSVEKTKEELEEIQWNIWRSNLQNQIMKDVKLPYVKEGVIFKFSFDVDKFGKVSNVQTWSTEPIYTPYAIQYIAPVIKSYQGHEILNFPQGSNRFITTARGAWKISKTLKYSTPNDFNDTEKIRK